MDRTSSCKSKWCGKRLPKGFPPPTTILTLVFWAVILFVAFYAFRAEVKHNGCYTERTHECISPFYRNAPEPGDTNLDLLKRLENGVRLPEEGVRWRRTLLIGFILSLALPLLIYRRMPSPIEFILSFGIIFLVLYMVDSWMSMHIWYRVQDNMQRSVDKLRENLGYITPSKLPGMYGGFNTIGIDQHPE